MILPVEGANTGTTPVHIYGRNFTGAICKELRCKFGELESAMVMYVSNNHIICEAPDISESVLRMKQEALESADPIRALKQMEILSKALVADISVPILVDFGDGNYNELGVNFTYKHDLLVPTTTATTTTQFQDQDQQGGFATNIYASWVLMIPLLLASFTTSQ